LLRFRIVALTIKYSGNSTYSVNEIHQRGDGRLEIRRLTVNLTAVPVNDTGHVIPKAQGAGIS
jgi:hypothetical protein